MSIEEEIRQCLGQNERRHIVQKQLISLIKKLETYIKSNRKPQLPQIIQTVKLCTEHQSDRYKSGFSSGYTSGGSVIRSVWDGLTIQILSVVQTIARQKIGVKLLLQEWMALFGSEGFSLVNILRSDKEHLQQEALKTMQEVLYAGQQVFVNAQDSVESNFTSFSEQLAQILCQWYDQMMQTQISQQQLSCLGVFVRVVPFVRLNRKLFMPTLSWCIEQQHPRVWYVIYRLLLRLGDISKVERVQFEQLVQIESCPPWLSSAYDKLLYENNEDVSQICLCLVELAKVVDLNVYVTSVLEQRLFGDKTQESNMLEALGQLVLVSNFNWTDQKMDIAVSLLRADDKAAPQAYKAMATMTIGEFAELAQRRKVYLLVVLLQGLHVQESIDVILSACEVVGVWSDFGLDNSVMDDIEGLLLELLQDGPDGIKSKVLWALACLVDRRSHCNYSRLALKLGNEHDKYKVSALRILSRWCVLIDDNQFEKEKYSMIAQVREFIIGCIISKTIMLKIKWNACRAAGVIMGKHKGFISTELVDALQDTLRDSKNFKVKISACQALMHAEVTSDIRIIAESIKLEQDDGYQDQLRESLARLLLSKSPP